MKQKETIYKYILNFNHENCQYHDSGFSDRYFKIMVDHIIDEARK